MKVIGIDPAPSKYTVIYNDIDGFTEIEADKLKKYLDDEFKNSEEDILICWDAPLTGGMSENFEDGDNPFYQRRIEILINKIIPKKIKNAWYNESKIIPKKICSAAPEISNNNLEKPFCTVKVSKRRLANSGGY